MTFWKFYTSRFSLWPGHTHGAMFLLTASYRIAAPLRQQVSHLPFSLQARADPQSCVISMVLLLPECHRSGITRCVGFPDWLFSLGNKPLRFAHVFLWLDYFISSGLWIIFHCTPLHLLLKDVLVVSVLEWSHYHHAWEGFCEDISFQICWEHDC